MNHRSIVVVVWMAVTVGVTALAGCLAVAAGAAAGVGTYAYVKGEMTTREDASLERVWAATQSAIEDLQIRVKEDAKDALQARVVAEKADGTYVTIKLEAEDENVTKISVRVGTFGDESESRLILDKIKERL